MAPAAVFCGIGMFLFGYTMAIGAPAALCAFLQGIMNVGVLIGIFSTLSYGLDSFRNQSNEIFVMNMFFKVRLVIFFFFRSMVLLGLFSLTKGAELHVLWSLQLRQ